MAWDIPAFDDALKICDEIKKGDIVKWKLPRLHLSLAILKAGQVEGCGPGSLFAPDFHQEIYSVADEIHRKDPTQDRDKLGSWGS